MVWNNAGEFFHMGGYGLYVWGSVAVTFLFMVVEVILVRHRRALALAGVRRAAVMAERDDDLEGGDETNRSGGEA